MRHKGNSNKESMHEERLYFAYWFINDKRTLRIDLLMKSILAVISSVCLAVHLVVSKSDARLTIPVELVNDALIDM